MTNLERNNVKKDNSEQEMGNKTSLNRKDQKQGQFSNEPFYLRILTRTNVTNDDSRNKHLKNKE